jgi:peptidoglycan/xylan/chitin deacetylase (PgdA/CDA1 family)
VKKLIKDCLSILNYINFKDIKLFKYNKLFIFNYHKISNKHRGRISTSLDVFKKQLDLFLDIGTVVDPSDLSSLFESNINLNKKPKFLITFDDGYYSVLENAYVPMKERKIKAISFLCTNKVGSVSDYEIDKNLKSKEKIITLDDIKNTRDVFSFQSHGANHIDYSRANISEIKEDIKSSSNFFYENLGYLPEFFAYPFGILPKNKTYIYKYLSEFGYKYAFKTGSSPISLPFKISPYEIERVGFQTDETLFHTKSRINGGLISLTLFDTPFIRNIKTKLNV